MTSLTQWAQYWAQYLALRATCGLMEPYPPDQSIQTARALATVYARCSGRRLARASANIARCFPGLARTDIDRIALESVRNMFALFLVDAIVMPKIVHEWSWPDYAELNDFGEALDLLISNEPCIFLTGHVGNWEFLGYFLALIGFRMTAIARPLDNPLVYKWLLQTREASGLKVLTKWGASDELQRIIESGGKIAFIADQNAGDDGVFVPFFNRLASSYKSIGLLAMRYRIPIVAGLARRVGHRFRYTVETIDIIRPADWEAHDDPLYYITARYNRAIETMIRRAPEQYLWVHRRWKSRPRHERAGDPMPERMRSKLRSLPWMDEALLQELEKPL
ncbi:MAG: lysophospholipid acyltransferase family protein [Phycisphaerae bacterium]|nr:lysophospholipid acyltransferase family protein [Phycisphaerae bacterium]